MITEITYKETIRQFQELYNSFSARGGEKEHVEEEGEEGGQDGSGERRRCYKSGELGTAWFLMKRGVLDKRIRGTKAGTSEQVRGLGSQRGTRYLTNYNRESGCVFVFRSQ